MIQDIFFRVISSFSLFVILPSYCISFLFILSSPMLFLICRRAKLSPSCSVDPPPSSRHTLIYGASLSSAFPCPIASYKAITLCLHPFLSICRLFPSVCLRLSFCFSVTCLHYVYIYQIDFDY